MTEFTPFYSALGGALIGISAMLLLWSLGRIAGISGIVGGLFEMPLKSADSGWRWTFIAGFLLVALLYPVLAPEALPALEVTFANQSLWPLVAGGLLVGYGTRLGSGCTSGHGVCGIGRLSARSIVATVIFMATAAVTVGIVRHLVGGL